MQTRTSNPISTYRITAGPRMIAASNPPRVRICVRVVAGDLAEIDAAAKRAGVCRSAYLRLAALDLSRRRGGDVMTRIALTDGTGRWFAPGAADLWEDATRWDGHNRVSLATGDQWEHERLYRTAGGRWVLHGWSQREGSRDSYAVITADAAAAWMAINRHAPHPTCTAEAAALELA